MVSALKVLIDITDENYDSFLRGCTDDMQREHVILKNGIVVYRKIEGRTQRVVSILCEESEARMLLTAAKSLDLPAAGEIRSALFPYRHMG